ncbi:thioesterase [Mycobacterium sp. 1554424.7]|nr:thioesterase [Mycobacterium sp. 1554424.7]
MPTAAGKERTGRLAPAQFKSWVRRFAARTRRGSVVVFPHAGGTAMSYRSLAETLAGNGVDTLVVQYPQRADRLSDPPAESIEALALELFDAGDWHSIAPLHLFGHSMGAVVAFEFARIAERSGLQVPTLWASAGGAPSSMAPHPQLPTSDSDVLAGIAAVGGTDPTLLADEEFTELLVKAVRADFRVMSGYSCRPDVRVKADIHAIGGNRDDHVSRAALLSWYTHTAGRFALSRFEGGHFYLNNHLEAVAAMVSARVR